MTTAVSTRSPRVPAVGLPIEYVPNETFLDPGHHDAILAPPPDQPADVPPGDDDESLALLTPAAERHLFRKMNFLRYRAETLRLAIAEGTAPAGADDRLAAKLRDATELRDELVLRNRRLVVFVAKRFADRRRTLDDLVSAGQPTLIRSVDLFDFARGFRFSTYAAWALRNQFVRLSKRRNRTGLTGATEGADVIAAAVDERSHPASEYRHTRAVAGLIADGVKVLNDRQRKVVTRRFGLDGSRPRRFREIGEELGVSTERARQILAQAIGRMRRHDGLARLDADDLCFREVG